MMKSQHLVAIFTVLFLNGNAVAQFGSGLPVIIPEPSSGVAPSLNSAPAIPLPELSSQDLALLEHATQANTQTATPFAGVLDDGEEADTLQPNQEMVDAGSAVAEGPEFAQIISLVQDLVDASARGSAEVREVIEGIKELLSKISDDVEYVNTLAEICGELKELPRDVLQKISGALGARLRNAMASWKLAEENYSSFIDLAAAFPEVALDTAVAELRAIIERDLLEGDFTKLITALTELSLLPERVAWMLLELSNRHADKFMAELKEGHGVYAFMQLIVRYPDQLEQLLEHSSAAAILVKVLTLSVDNVDNDDFPPSRLFPYSGSRDRARSRSRSRSRSSSRSSSYSPASPLSYSSSRSPSPSRERDCRDDRSLLSEAGIDQEKLEKLLRYFAEVNPAGFVELMSAIEFKKLMGSGMRMYCYKTRQALENTIANVAQDYPELLVRSPNDGGVVSLAERAPEVFIRVIMMRPGILEYGYLMESFTALAEKNPRVFVELLDISEQQDSGCTPTTLYEAAKGYPELVIRSKESEVESLAEKSPQRAFRFIINDWFRDTEQLRKGLEFLVVHKPQAVIDMLDTLLQSGAYLLFDERCSTFLDVILAHPELLVGSNDGVECLAERAPKTLLEILCLIPDISESANFRENLSALAKRNPKAFVKLLSSGPLPPVIREVANAHPELLIGGNGVANSLVEENPSVFSTFLMDSDTLNDERLHEGLESLARRQPQAFINLLLQLKSFPDRQRSVVIDVVRRHPELIIGCLNNGEVASLAERDPGAFVAILTRYPDILNGEQLRGGLAFLAARKPKKFIKLLTKWKELHAIGCLPIVMEVARRHPGLLISGSSEGITKSLLERDPDAFMRLAGEEIPLDGEQLRRELDLLAAREPRAFVAFLKAWAFSAVEWAPMVVEIVRNHPELLIRSSKRSRVKSLAEKEIGAFIAILVRYADILDNEQLQKGVEFLATHEPETFIALLLHWGSLPHLLRSSVREVAKNHPELLMNADDRTVSLAERDPLMFIRLLKEAAIMDVEHLYDALNSWAGSVTLDSSGNVPDCPFRRLLVTWLEDSPTELLPIAIAIACKHGVLQLVEPSLENSDPYGGVALVGSNFYSFSLLHEIEIGSRGWGWGLINLADEQLQEGLEFLAAHDPEAFYVLEVMFSYYSWPPVVVKLARQYPELFIRSSDDSAVESLAEKLPSGFVSLMLMHDVLNDKQLQDGLEFLATHKPGAFLALLKAWLFSVPSGRLPIVIKVAREHEDLLLRLASADQCVYERISAILSKKHPGPLVKPLSDDETLEDDDLGPKSPKNPRHSRSAGGTDGTAAL